MNASPALPARLFATAFLSFLGILIAGRIHGADAPPAITVDPITEALPILQAGYYDYAGLHVAPDNHLADLLRRSQGAISLQPALSGPAASPEKITSALLPDGVVYCRLASFIPAMGWADWAGQLKAWAAQGAHGVVLDLRTTSTPDDFAGAAQVAGLFLAPGIPLFTMNGAGMGSHSYETAGPAAGFAPPMINGPIAVLTNERTAGAGEALAACLKANGAFTLGRWTSGNGAAFSEHKMTDGTILRYVSAQVTMADGTPLWRHAVEPDIGLLTDAKKEDVVLQLIAQDKVLDVIRESLGSHRQSEAALVRGDDPAVEAYLVPREKPAPLPPQDTVLVTALDSLKAIRVSEEKPVSPVPEQAAIPSAVQ